MKEGSVKPISPAGDGSRKKRNLKLFPEEDPSNDRIIGMQILNQHVSPLDPGLTVSSHFPIILETFSSLLHSCHSSHISKYMKLEKHSRPGNVT